AVRDRFRRGFAQSEDTARELARPCGKAHGQNATDECFVECGHHSRAVENRVCSRRERNRLRIREAARIDQNELRESHRVHRAGGCADIAWVARRNKDDPYGREAIEVYQHRGYERSLATRMAPAVTMAALFFCFACQYPRHATK